ncbi:MAG: SDR family NAD(P)-dependent oxidoreductase, partial [Myxococcales bacterium]|nr:SDR family NAD(P)-dependent oxidoreductase [Myxococcales bacterium]
MSDRRRALVTGASSGIGEHIARRLAHEGFDLVLVARRREMLEALASELSRSVKVEVLIADLTDPGAPLRIVESIGPDGVDVLVNNAGGGWIGTFAEAPLERQLQIVDLNVRALVELTHRLLGPMKQRGRGHIVQIASVAGFMP